MPRIDSANSLGKVPMLRFAHLVFAFSSLMAMALPDQQQIDAQAAKLTKSSSRHIIGNIYSVATSPGQVYLIKTPKGHIILDCGERSSVFQNTILPPVGERGIDEVVEGITALGFRVEDVRILLHSHEHIDHGGCLGELKRRSGAKMVASAPARSEFERWRPPSVETPLTVDRIIGDGDTVSLGGVTLTAHLTPGHTPGALTWSTTVLDHGKPYTVVFEPSMIDVDVGYWPEAAMDFERSFATWRTLRPDVFLGAHGAGGFFRDSLGRPVVAHTLEEWRQKIDAYEKKFRKGLAQHISRLLTPYLIRETGMAALAEHIKMENLSRSITK